MKWMKAGQTEQSARSPERGSAPFGIWRSEVLYPPVQGAGFALRSSVPDPTVQDRAPNDIVPVPDRTLRELAQDEQPPVRIFKEGLLG